MSTKYDSSWFHERALASLSRIEDGVWDYSDSLLLYTAAGSDVYEQLQHEDTPYFHLVTKPEHEYLQLIAPEIARSLPDHFDFIDLGPGTEHKEQLLFNELKKLGKTFRYIPVDISEQFLDLASAHASKQGIETKSLQVSFEELPELLPESDVPRFVSLGLTFSNYNPLKALDLLRQIASTDGWFFINTQMRDRVDMDKLLEVYQNDAIDMADEKIQLLGLDPDTDVTPRTADDGFRVWCTVKKNAELLESLGVRENDKLLVFQSLRYTKGELEDLLVDSVQSKLLDVGSSFIGVLAKV